MRPDVRFAVGQRVRVKLRRSGMQYYCAGQEATVIDHYTGSESHSIGCGSQSWYLVDVKPFARFYAPEQLEAVR